MTIFSYVNYWINIILLYYNYRSDTSIILGTCVGIQTGWWFNFHYHIVKRSESQSAYITNDLEWSNLGIYIFTFLYLISSQFSTNFLYFLCEMFPYFLLKIYPYILTTIFSNVAGCSKLLL